MNERINQLAHLLLGQHWDTLHERQQKVFKHVAERSSITRNINHAYESQLTFGERMADAVASFGGSWTFILLFLGFLVVWAFSNTVLLGNHAIDPYPYIFLNLMLSMLAALQAPIIMMSQNRQSAKDRLAAEHDYEVNLKAEVEICQLHDKLDELRARQLAELVSLQQQQVDLLKQIAERVKGSETLAAPVRPDAG
jgi:uncharacterized membrane protein